MKIITDIHCTDYERPGHPERPQRVSATLDHLKAASGLGLEFSLPTAIDMGDVGRVHPEPFVSSLTQAADFDEDTPAHRDIQIHALRSVAGALDAKDFALSGTPALSLLRPPGHHASAEAAMGFCYLNQIAVAAMAAASDGLKVGILDFDVHHGNGTEGIVLGRENLLYASAHQSPAYPGTGSQSKKNCKNYPVRPHAPREDFSDAVKRGFDDIMDLEPDLIGVSAGFDAFRGDPLAQENLEAQDYFTFGRMLRDCGVPVFSVLEGGYSDELPHLVTSYIEGLNPPSL